MLLFIIPALTLGLSAGFTPGPLSTLTIVQTLKHNIKEGIKVAISPLITDAPIVALSILVLSKLETFNFLLGIISLFGALFLAYLGLENIKTTTFHILDNVSQPKSLTKGVLANLLSPYPYVFWVAIGGPITLKALEVSVFDAIVFIMTFYLTMIVSKIVIAMIVGKSKNFLNSKIYAWLMKTLGIVLIIFALMFFMQALEYFAILV